MGKDGSKIREDVWGNPETDKKTEKLDSVGGDGSKVREDFWSGPGTEKKTEKKSKSNRSVRRGLKIREDSEKILGPHRQSSNIEPYGNVGSAMQSARPGNYWDENQERQTSYFVETSH